MSEKSANETLQEFLDWVDLQIKNFGDIPYKCSKCGHESGTSFSKNKCPQCGYSQSTLMHRLMDIFGSFTMLFFSVFGSIGIGYFVFVLYKNGDINNTIFYVIEIVLLGYVGRSLLLNFTNIAQATKSSIGKKYLIQGRKYLKKCIKGQDFYLAGMFSFSKGIHEFGLLFRNDNSLFTPPTYGTDAINLLKKIIEINQIPQAQIDTFRDILFGELLLRYLLQPSITSDLSTYSQELKYLSYNESKVIEIANIISNNHPSWLTNGRMLELVKIINEKSPKIALILSGAKSQ